MEWISKIKVPKKQPDVDGRLVVRARFKIARQFLTPLTMLINLGFATKRRGKTAMGRAMSYMLLRCEVSVLIELALLCVIKLTF